jgi:hypothetical protein
MALAQRRTAARWGSIVSMSALRCAGLVVGDEAAAARPRPVVGGAKIGAGHSAHAGIAELARSAMSVRPRRNGPARVGARPLTEPMNARLSTRHTPIISGDVQTRMLLSSHFGPAAESNRLPRNQRTRYDRPAKHPGLKHRSEFLRDLSRAARGDGVGGLRHLAIASGEGLPPDRYCAFIYCAEIRLAMLDTACHGQRRWCAILGSIQTDLLVNYGAAGEDRPLTWGPFWDHTLCALVNDLRVC